MNYWWRHWRGEQELVWSIFVNMIVIGGVALLALQLISRLGESDAIVTETRIYVAVGLTYLFVVFPWQVIGSFRSVKRAARTHHSWFTGLLGYLSIISFIATLLWQLSVHRDVLEMRLKVALGLPVIGDYELYYSEERNGIVFDGGIEHGAASDLNELLLRYPNTDFIELNSQGGWVLEGRKMARVIQLSGINTFVRGECSSACTLAYIAGDRRFMMEDGYIGFHSYANEFNKNPSLGLEEIYEWDIGFFQEQGVSVPFTNVMFEEPSSSMWYPPNETLLDHGVVHRIFEKQ